MLGAVTSIVASIVTAIWFIINMTILEPIKNIEQEMKSLRLQYAEEITDLKTRVAFLEKNAERLRR